MHRIVRIGQPEQCIIYKIIATDSVDVYMGRMAAGKAQMLLNFPNPQGE